MRDFNQIRKVCNENSAISRLVLDEFIMYYAAEREGFDSEMVQRFKPFTQVLKQFESSWINSIKAQYIVHRIFRNNGLIKKYLQHAAINQLPPQQQQYLKEQAATPWRYSFSRITDNPRADFYEMQEAFTEKSYLIYSPSITQILSEGPVLLWFNLIGFNGACWQSYGPVTSFAGFTPDDIFFFATELNPAIDTDEALLADMENNPLPYTMLLSGSRYPLTLHGTDEILQVVAEHSLKTFESSQLKIDCKIEYAQGIYRISPRSWSEPPHFAAAYYAEEKQQLLLSSLTDRGFRALITMLNKNGFGLPPEPDIRVHLPMLMSVKRILSKDIKLNPYEEVFKIDPEPGKEEEIVQLNRFMALALPIINTGREPDLRLLAKEAGVDEQTARELLQLAMGRINILKKRKTKGK